MAEPSPPPQPEGFGRGTLIVGLVLIAIAGSLAAFGFAKLRNRADLGTLIYAGRQGLFEHDLSSGKDQRIARLPTNTVVAEPSPDGRYVAYANEQGAVWLIEIVTKRRFQIAERFSAPEGWSPDSKLVAREFLGDGDIVLIDPDGGRKGLISNPPPTLGIPVWISEDYFAIGTPRDPDHSLIVDVRNGRAYTGRLGVPLVASPDAKQLLFQREKKVWVGTLRGGKIAGQKVVFKGDANAAAVSRQGFVAIAAEDGKGRRGVWVLENGTRTRRIVDGKADWLAWTLDGSAVLYSRNGAIYARDLARKDTERISRRDVKVFDLLSFAVVRS